MLRLGSTPSLGTWHLAAHLTLYGAQNYHCWRESVNNKIYDVEPVPIKFTASAGSKGS